MRPLLSTASLDSSDKATSLIVITSVCSLSLISWASVQVAAYSNNMTHRPYRNELETEAWYSPAVMMQTLWYVDYI